MLGTVTFINLFIFPSSTHFSHLFPPFPVPYSTFSLLTFHSIHSHLFFFSYLSSILLVLIFIHTSLISLLFCCAPFLTATPSLPPSLPFPSPHSPNYLSTNLDSGARVMPVSAASLARLPRFSSSAPLMREGGREAR